MFPYPDLNPRQLLPSPSRRSSGVNIHLLGLRSSSVSLGTFPHDLSEGLCYPTSFPEQRRVSANSDTHLSLTDPGTHSRLHLSSFDREPMYVTVRSPGGVCAVHTVSYTYLIRLMGSVYMGLDQSRSDRNPGSHLRYVHLCPTFYPQQREKTQDSSDLRLLSRGGVGSSSVSVEFIQTTYYTVDGKSIFSCLVRTDRSVIKCK